jgi:hypothetical protein
MEGLSSSHNPKSGIRNLVGRNPPKLLKENCIIEGHSVREAKGSSESLADWTVFVFVLKHFFSCLFGRLVVVAAETHAERHDISVACTARPIPKP